MRKIAMIDLQCLPWAWEGEMLAKSKLFACQPLKVGGRKHLVASLGSLLSPHKPFKGNGSDFDSKPLKSEEGESLSPGGVAGASSVTGLLLLPRTSNRVFLLFLLGSFIYLTNREALMC